MTVDVAKEAPLLTSDHIRTALQGASGPQSAEQVRKALPKAVRPSSADMTALLSDEVAAGRLYRYPAARGAGDRYSDRSPAERAKELLLQRLSKRPQSRTEALRNLGGIELRGSPVLKQLPDLLRELVAAGHVRQQPAYLGGRSPLFSVRPADPQDYVRQAFAKLAARLEVSLDDLIRSAALLSHDDEPAAAPPDETPVESASPEPSAAEDAARLVLEAMHDLNPAVAIGDVVAVAELRRRLDFQLDKPTFDQCLLRLAQEWKVTLHGFDHAAALSPAERSVLVEDEQGRVYNVVSLRREV